MAFSLGERLQRIGAGTVLDTSGSCRTKASIIGQIGNADAQTRPAGRSGPVAGQFAGIQQLLALRLVVGCVERNDVIGGHWRANAVGQ